VGRSLVLRSGTGRAATRGGGAAIELVCDITVYPARTEGGRWRAVWFEDGQREQCEAATEDKLAAKLEGVKVRLEADAPKMRQPGATGIWQAAEKIVFSKTLASVSSARTRVEPAFEPGLVGQLKSGRSDRRLTPASRKGPGSA
jgi:hypothetical protein